ncbi:MAG: 2,3-bisphosphoglycerate-independent phosphoglycerate mutase [Gemmatimonadaceae bacterium]|nr:2,3-bisphosphoglycerate-independent phosphoglycerate mutase [Gemmatimonadaceae bacterium]
MPRPSTRPVVLVVIDGFGHRDATEGNAVAMARMPTWSRLWAKAPRTLLDASGLAVGLPAGQMGNSEVGHLNLGAGRVVKQDLVRIEEAIADRSFFSKAAFVDACAHVKRNGGTLHLLGLLGDGGVHAMESHLFALLDLAEQQGVTRLAIQALMDGRDTLPTNGYGYMQKTLAMAAGRAQVASLGGRYFGMDRDKRWERVRKWYDSVTGVGPTTDDPLAAIRAAYDRGETDEFITPMTVVKDGVPVAPIRDGDAIIGFNYRSDRMRQMVRALTQGDFAGFDISARPSRLHLATMTSYDETFSFPVAFPPFSMARIVAEVVSETGMTMFRTAETEKYPHVTYFYNGGIEAPFAGEVRNLVASPKVPTYDLQPEMSAAGVTDVLVEAIESGSYDFTLCNYANADMVGHTGSIPAVIKALETVDSCLARVIAAAEKQGARLLITADHGNCEVMIDPETGGPHTAHTTNPVPMVVLDPDGDRPMQSGGALCDVGPTILSMLGIEQPTEMTGRALRLPS